MTRLLPLLVPRPDPTRTVYEVVSAHLEQVWDALQEPAARWCVANDRPPPVILDFEVLSGSGWVPALFGLASEGRWDGICLADATANGGQDYEVGVALSLSDDEAAAPATLVNLRKVAWPYLGRIVAHELAHCCLGVTVCLRDNEGEGHAVTQAFLERAAGLNVELDFIRMTAMQAGQAVSVPMPSLAFGAHDLLTAAMAREV